jgi:hypothetical protein
VALTWWQVSRALGGNELSWVYTFEWPLFGTYAVYMWWKLVHDDPATPPRAGDSSEHAGGTGASEVAETARPGAAEPPGDRTGDHEEDGELAAYNRYLADLNASGRQKRW